MIQSTLIICQSISKTKISFLILFDPAFDLRENWVRFPSLKEKQHKNEEKHHHHDKLDLLGQKQMGWKKGWREMKNKQSHEKETQGRKADGLESN